MTPPPPVTPKPEGANDHRATPEGRALLVGGEVKIAKAIGGNDWAGPDTVLVGVDGAAKARLVSELRAFALARHASVAAYARALCELVALGAPARLVERTQQVLGDRVRHTSAAFALLAACGDPARPSSLPEATDPLATSPADVARGVVQACVGETIAAHRSARRADSHRAMQIREFYNQIAEDEARHVAVAFETLRWLHGSSAEHRAAVEDAIAAMRVAATQEVRTVALPLFEEALSTSRAKA